MFIDCYNTMISNVLLASALHQFELMYPGVATSRQGGRLYVGHKFQSRLQQQEEVWIQRKSAAPKGRPSMHCTSKPNTSYAIIGT